MSRRSSVIRRDSSASRNQSPAETPAVERGYRYLVPWLLLFAGSGCAALIYEIVWFQLLQLVIGSSAVSLGLLLAAYMGGLCLGSAALPRLVSARHHPMRVYAFLELGIAAFGIIALFGVPLIGRLYVAGASHRIGGPDPARRGCGGLPASSHVLDGRLASRHRPLGGNDAARSLLAGPAL